ncbi:hypothetical protein ACQY0O_006834 [Thecaphora frezii]
MLRKWFREAGPARPPELAERDDETTVRGRTRLAAVPSGKERRAETRVRRGGEEASLPSSSKAADGKGEEQKIRTECIEGGARDDEMGPQLMCVASGRYVVTLPPPPPEWTGLVQLSRMVGDQRERRGSSPPSDLTFDAVNVSQPSGGKSLRPPRHPVDAHAGPLQPRPSRIEAESAAAEIEDSDVAYDRLHASMVGSTPRQPVRTQRKAKTLRDRLYHFQRGAWRAATLQPAQRFGALARKKGTQRDEEKEREEEEEEEDEVWREMKRLAEEKVQGWVERAASRGDAPEWGADVEVGNDAWHDLEDDGRLQLAMESQPQPQPQPCLAEKSYTAQASTTTSTAEVTTKPLPVPPPDAAATGSNPAPSTNHQRRREAIRGVDAAHLAMELESLMVRSHASSRCPSLADRSTAPRGGCIPRRSATREAMRPQQTRRTGRDEETERGRSEPDKAAERGMRTSEYTAASTRLSFGSLGPPTDAASRWTPRYHATPCSPLPNGDYAPSPYDGTASVSPSPSPSQPQCDIALVPFPILSYHRRADSSSTSRSSLSTSTMTPSLSMCQGGGTSYERIRRWRRRVGSAVGESAVVYAASAASAAPSEATMSDLTSVSRSPLQLRALLDEASSDLIHNSNPSGANQTGTLEAQKRNDPERGRNGKVDARTRLEAGTRHRYCLDASEAEALFSSAFARPLSSSSPTKNTSCTPLPTHTGKVDRRPSDPNANGDETRPIVPKPKPHRHDAAADRTPTRASAVIRAPYQLSLPASEDRTIHTSHDSRSLPSPSPPPSLQAEMENTLGKIKGYVERAGDLTNLQRQLVDIHQKLIGASGHAKDALEERVRLLERAVFQSLHQVDSSVDWS